MPTLTIEYTTEQERLQYERMIAYVQEIMRLGGTAAPGTVIDSCERFALDQGRQLIRGSLEAALQSRADAEKKLPTTARKDPRSVGSSRRSGRSR